MLIRHQCGHNFVWNLDSFQDDEVGNGLIVSPVNIASDKIAQRFPLDVRQQSFLDPQFFLPADAKGQLETYDFFPGIVLEEFSTSEFGNHAPGIADSCLRFQLDHDFAYLVIPTRYVEDLPTNHLEQLDSVFVEPFLDSHAKLNSETPVLLTVIAKEVQLKENDLRDELLTWVTGKPGVRGVYLILDDAVASKQIKDPEVLARMMELVYHLKRNGMEVHVGYNDVEGLLYGVPGADSIAMGSFENLRSFSIRRLESRDSGPQRGPRPRVGVAPNRWTPHE